MLLFVNSKLISYLEAMKNLALPNVTRPRAHAPTAVCQSPKETAQDFLIRALDLRQQVLFAPQAETGVMKFADIGSPVNIPS